MFCIGTEAQFKKFCEMVNHQEWLQDERFRTNSARKQHEECLVALITNITLTKTRDEWIDLLQAYKIPGGRVNTVAEALEQPQAQARDLIGSLTHPQYGTMRFVKNPLQHFGLNISYDQSPPILGEHTDEVLNLYKV